MKSWVRENKTAVTLGAIALAVTAIWIYRRRSMSPHFMVSGVWTDLAAKQGLATGDDLSIKEAQGFLNVINAQTPPSEGGDGLEEDGVLSTETADALQKFQAGNGLSETRVLDQETGSALSYFSAAVSKVPSIKKAAVVSPETIASITPAMYAQPVRPRTTYASPLSPRAQPRSRTTRAHKPLLAARDIGQGWVMYGNCACRWNDAACAARCGGARPSLPPPSLSDTARAGDFRTGIQSTSMYSPQNYYTDSYGAWVLPAAPEWCWWA
jgi:peptidoglycan hydrolase-like protein with peptidoglycan-binding domain